MTTITTKNGQIPVRLTMLTFAKIENEFGKPFLTLASEGLFASMSKMMKVIQIALNEAARRNGSGEEYDEDKVDDLINDNPNFYTDFVELLAKQVTAMAGEAKDDAEKKPTAATKKI